MSKSINYSEEYKQSLGVAINSMLADGAVGKVYVDKRVVANLIMEPVNCYDENVNLVDNHSLYDLIIFDGGNTHGDLWKWTFYPQSGVFHFINESDVTAN